MDGKPEMNGQKGFLGNIVGQIRKPGQFDILGKVKNFASSAAEIAKSIDEDLNAKGSAYEIAYFRVMGNVSVVGGLTLDIHFTKTALAKESDIFLVVINPHTGGPIKIPKKSLMGMEKAKVKDMQTGEVFLIDARNGKILHE